MQSDPAMPEMVVDQAIKLSQIRGSDGELRVRMLIADCTGTKVLLLLGEPAMNLAKGLENAGRACVAGLLLSNEDTNGKGL